MGNGLTEPSIQYDAYGDFAVQAGLIGQTVSHDTHTHTHTHMHTHTRTDTHTYTHIHTHTHTHTHARPHTRAHTCTHIYLPCGPFPHYPSKHLQVGVCACARACTWQGFHAPVCMRTVYLMGVQHGNCGRVCVCVRARACVL